jgi:tetratricopeptide (TPR) repeat protein
MGPVPQGPNLTAEEAERLCRDMMSQHQPGSDLHVQATWQLMRLMAWTQRRPEAVELLDGLLPVVSNPETKAEIILAMGQLHEQSGDFEGAMEFYSRGVALEPVGTRTWYLLHNNLGYCLNQVRRHEEAEKWCLQAIAIDPPRFNAHKNLGIAYTGQGRWDEAARCFLRATHSNPDDERALMHLATLLNAHPEILEDLELAAEIAAYAEEFERMGRQGPHSSS